MYNMTSIWAANNTLEILTAVNDKSDSMLFIFLMMVLWVILLFVFKRNDFTVATIVSSFIMSIIFAYSWVIRIISFKILILPLVILIIATFIYMFVDR